MRRIMLLAICIVAICVVVAVSYWQKGIKEHFTTARGVLEGGMEHLYADVPKSSSLVLDKAGKPVVTVDGYNIKIETNGTRTLVTTSGKPVTDASGVPIKVDLAGKPIAGQLHPIIIQLDGSGKKVDASGAVLDASGSVLDASGAGVSVSKLLAAVPAHRPADRKVEPTHIPVTDSSGAYMPVTDSSGAAIMPLAPLPPLPPVAPLAPVPTAGQKADDSTVYQSLSELLRLLVPGINIRQKDQALNEMNLRTATQTSDQELIRNYMRKDLTKLLRDEVINLRNTVPILPTSQTSFTPSIAQGIENGY